MKKFTKLVTLLMLVLLFCAIPLQAKTIKSSDQKTAKKQINTMLPYLSEGVGRKIYKNLKYKKSYTYNFDKKAARTYFLNEISLYGDDENATENTISKWFFGYSGKNKINQNYAYTDWGLDGFVFGKAKITKSGKYYTAKCNVYYVHNSEKTGKDIKRKMGTCTFTFKLKSNTHYGLIVKKAKVTRTVKSIASLTKD